MGQKRQCNSNNFLLFFCFPKKKSRLYLKKDLSTSKRVFKTIEILKKKNHHKIPEKSIIHAAILLKTDKLKPNWSVLLVRLI